MKIVAVLCLVLGEALAIFAEMMSAKLYAGGGTHSFWPIFIKAFIAVTLAGALLIAGYMLGVRSFKSIWIVIVLSITPILIIEPIMGYALFETLPSRGASVGLIFGTLGFIATCVL